LVPDMVGKGVKVTLRVLTAGLERAMNEANARPNGPKAGPSERKEGN
jgi:hypothetical protein